jgi:hypothetical protein
VTDSEAQRFIFLKKKALERIRDQLRDALEHTRNSKARLKIAPMTELLEQAYYQGREDGSY